MSFSVRRNRAGRVITFWYIMKNPAIFVIWIIFINFFVDKFIVYSYISINKSKKKQSSEVFQEVTIFFLGLVGTVRDPGM